jgi:Protein of unknown function (DUF3072)
MEVSHAESRCTKNLHHPTGEGPNKRVACVKEQIGSRHGYADMPSKSKVVAQMTAEQAALLRKIAFDAYEPEAFSPNLTKAEAERRIDMLKAKLKLMGEPPHTQ